MNAETIMARAKDLIMQTIYRNRESQTIAGGVSIKLQVIPEGLNWSNNEEEDRVLSALGITREYSVILEEFYTAENSSFLYDDIDNSKWIFLPAAILMMRAWVNQCLGEDCRYQVALTRQQYKKITKEFAKKYKRIPEQSGVSPRGGSIVEEIKIPNFRIQLDVTCLTELGPERDLRIASKAVNQMRGDVLKTLSIYNPEISVYPNVDAVLRKPLNRSASLALLLRKQRRSNDWI